MRKLITISFLCAALMLFTGVGLATGEGYVSIDSPMSPPVWALMERELLRANTAACQEFYTRYFDERGYLECVERWGGNDGPDDAIENVNDWPILHALGAPDVILTLYKKAWEGHLRQWTEARTTHVPFARDGMYYKEFPVMFDWLHNGEGLTVFNLQGLSDPEDLLFQQRVRRFAGFYMNEDPQAPNYDPEHKIIRSIFNGSRGPLLRKSTGLDWAGDPIEVKDRFVARHGESTYEQFVQHFKDYNDIVGDSPMNLSATTLALNAYMLAHEPKYKEWLLEYVDAWVERTRANGGIIPTNIGLDGTIGGETDGKWYGGVYGWAFTVVRPESGELVHRNNHRLGLAGFGNAYLLTGDRCYLDVWGEMIDKVNSNMKVVDGKKLYPHMYGDDGWYHYTPEKYSHGAFEIYYWTMDPAAQKRLPITGWVAYQEGVNPDYPEQAMRDDFEHIRDRIAAMRQDALTPDTRLADNPMPYRPVAVQSLIELMLGGFHPRNKGNVLHCRVRYFDPENRRAGIPEDVAALVEKMTADDVRLTLVNINQTEPRTVVVQAGAYAEHRCTGVRVGSRELEVDGPFFTVRLAPGAGETMAIKMKRYANQPTMTFPWDRGWMAAN